MNGLTAPAQGLRFRTEGGETAFTRSLVREHRLQLRVNGADFAQLVQGGGQPLLRRGGRKKKPPEGRNRLEPGGYPPPGRRGAGGHAPP